MTDVRNALLASAVAASLAACAVGPDFQRPAAPAADRYTANALPVTTAAADVAHGGAQEFEPGQELPAAWWRAFGSPQLNAVVERALRANPDLQAADAALRQAQQTLAAQRGAWRPQADLHVDASRQRDSVVPAPDAGIDTPYALRTAQLSVSYTLDVFGGTRRQVEAAGAQAQAQRDQRDAAYLSLTANVVNAAIGEAAVRGQLDAARAQVAIAKQLCTLTERQQTLGALGAAQVLAQRTALAQAQAAVRHWKSSWNNNGPCSRFWAGNCLATLRVRHLRWIPCSFRRNCRYRCPRGCSIAARTSAPPKRRRMLPAH